MRNQNNPTAVPLSHRLQRLLLAGALPLAALLALTLLFGGRQPRPARAEAPARPADQTITATQNTAVTFNQSTFAGRAAGSTVDTALGDIDGDGDLDLAIADEFIGPQLYINDNGVFQPTPVWPPATTNDASAAVAWGDIDGDGDLDLAVGNTSDTCFTDICTSQNVIYRNVNGRLEATPVWTSTETAATAALAWGDLNNDGWLDLVVANRGAASLDFNDTYDGEANHIYFNQNGSLPASASWTSAEADQSASLALGDLDLDGDLDIVIGNLNDSNRIYDNESGTFATAATWNDSSGADNYATDIALGDMDRDGYLDLAVAGHGGDFYNASRVYDNILGLIDTDIYWDAGVAGATAVAWGDYNGDGYLDLALGTGEDVKNRIHYYDADQFTLTDAPGWQSIDQDATGALAAGDLNGDGAIDLLAGNYDQRNRLYLNQGFTLDTAVSWQALTTSDSPADAFAWGDADNDGDLDLAIATADAITIFRNDGLDEFEEPQFQPGTPIRQPAGETWRALAWGDANGDGWLDLAAASSVISDTTATLLTNQQNPTAPAFATTWTTVLTNTEATAVHFADFNNDTTLDLFIATKAVSDDDFNFICLPENSVSSAIFLNHATSTTLSAAPAWQFPTPTEDEAFCFEGTNTAVSGDLDNDGDLDLVLGGADGTRLLRQDSANPLRFTTIWQETGTIFATNSVALGDLDGDGDLDLAQGTQQANTVHRNENGIFVSPPAWTSPDSTNTNGISLGDMDGDGDLDMAAANEFVKLVVYRNENGMLSPTLDDRWQGPEQVDDVAWADIDGDGDLDLSAPDWLTQFLVYRNTRQDVPGLTNHAPAIRIQNPIGSGGAPGNGAVYGRYLTTTEIPIRYTLADPEGDAVARIEAFFSTNGGGSWLPAMPADGTQTTYLAAAPNGSAHTFTWDTFASGLFGQARHATLMLVAYESAPADHTNAAGTVTYIGNVGGSSQRPFSTAATTPFPVQGTQVRVQNQNGAPIVGAHVYRLPAGQSFGGQLMPSAANPLTTNNQGLLAGSSVINLNDGLMAMLPLPVSGTTTNAIDFTDQAQYYLTSARPNSVTLSLAALQAPGLFNLTTPTDTTGADYNPLLLFDLIVSTEWDATDEPLFMPQLADAFQQASTLLYDVSNGQVALGRVYIYPNKAYWDSADVVVYANNSLRPSASIGGVTQRPLPETVLTATGAKTIPDAYLRGQIRMGTVWNPYGEQAAELSDDWWQALAHELAHYLLFLPDNYLGFVDGTFSRVNCQGSFMTSTYDPDYSEFLIQPEWDADPDCLNTLANTTTGRTDWETITTFYPLLKAPSADVVPFAGPVILPINTTSVWPTAFANRRTPLPARTFDVRDALNRRLRLPNAQVYLFQTQATADPGDDIVLLLGSPTAGGDRIKVRGAYPGDRLCLYDHTPGSRYAGCINALSASDVALRVSAAPSNWQPDVSARAVTSRTLQISVTQAVAGSANLNVQVIPAHYGSAPCTAGLSPTAVMTRDGSSHSATISMLAPAYDVTVRVWLGNDPIRETLTSFLLNWPQNPPDGASFPPPPAPDCELPDYELGGLLYTTVANPSTNPVGGPSTNPVGGPSTNPVGGPSTNPVGGPSTNPVGGPSTNPVGGPSTNPVGGPSTNPVGGPSTNPVGGAPFNLLAGPSTNPVGGPSTNPVGGPSTNPVGGPSTNPVGGPSTNPVGGAQSRILSAPFWSTDAQVVIYNETGFFEDNGVAGLQKLSSVPGLAPWLVLVGQAHHVTPDTAVTDPRSISFSYLQRNVPEGYEHTLSIHFRSDSSGVWQELPTRRFVENLVVASLQDEPGIYAVMASIALPPLRPGWNLMAYPLPDSRPAATALSALGDRVTAVLPYDPDAANPFSPPADNAQTPAGLELEFGRIYWVRLDPGPDLTPYLAPPQRGPDGNFLRLE